MTPEKQTPQTIDQYMADFEPEVQARMASVRQLVRTLVPEALETISWAMPTFKYRKKNLLHFAGHKTHLGLYPGPEAMVAFADELTTYKTSKGALQLPYNQPLPIDLITRIIHYRVAALS